ncbi:UvrD-helicase domain-containing protein [Luteolibacter algae]|uniref:DNA 3'-5' helicase n=1 Tax=Luteolibacter algae TaxID=454151 RepID=A0ABW5D711_9BACT
MIPTDLWTPADGLILEPNAERAVRESSENLALTAGPGAGKTEMLAQRADFLLRTGTCRYPHRILAISFKTDACRNLKERVSRRCGPALSVRFDSYTFHGFAKRIIDRFRPALTGRDRLDHDYTIGTERIEGRQITFGDLIPLATQIVENSKIARNAIQLTYRDVFLDEFQDCTDSQYELIKAIFLDTQIRLTAVGDTKQRIMGWAGALDGIFQTFASDFNATGLNMYRNFRSKPRLLRLQNEIIKILDPASVMPPDQLQGGAGEIHILNFENSQEEAEVLALMIASWIETEKIPLGEIAILVSKQAELYTDKLVVALESHDIPIRNESQLQDPLSEPLTRLIVDYLLVVFGSRQPAGYIRLMNQILEIDFDDLDLADELKQKNDWNRFFQSERKLVELDGGAKASFETVWSLIEKFIKRIGRRKIVALSPEYESTFRRKQVFREAKEIIRKSLAMESNIEEAIGHLTDDQAVKVLTIHKSKGLEFDTVIILGVENQNFWGTHDEKLCAFFVGVSRAKKRLVMTCSSERPRPDGHTGTWHKFREPQEEFLGFAEGI